MANIPRCKQGTCSVGIDVGAFLNEESHHCFMAMIRRCPEGVSIRSPPGMDIDAFLNEQSHQFFIVTIRHESEEFENPLGGFGYRGQRFGVQGEPAADFYHIL